MRALRLASLAFAVTLATAAVSQTASPAPTPAEKAQWLERANLITAAIQEDANNLPPDLQFVLPGRLGELWRSVDPKRAQAWMDQALAKISTLPETESAEQRKARLEAASAWLPGLNQSDAASADRVLDSLIVDVQRNNAGNPGGWQYSNDAAMLGMSVEQAIGDSAQQDPQRAFQLAQRIIQLREGNNVLGVYMNLRSADPQLADRFALDALEAARNNNYDVVFFFALAQLAAPLANVPEIMHAPEAVRSQILEALAAGMLRPVQNAADKASICDLAMPVTIAMKKFPPEQQGPLRAAVDNCTATNPQTRRMVGDMEARTRDSASADLLAQAADTNDARSRASLKQEAARRAEREKDFLRALDIWESFTTEERDAFPLWQSMWRHAVGQALTTSYRAHDLTGVQQLIARAPDNMRPALILQAANLGFSSKDAGYGITMLTQAHRELEKNPVTDDYRVYLNLLMLYTAHVSEEAPAALRLAVKGINDFKIPENAKVKPFEPGSRLGPITVPAGLLDSDPQMVSAAVSELKSPQARVAMRLGLLQACLQRYQGSAQPPAPKTDSKTPAAPTLKTDAKPAAKPEAEQKKN